MQNLKTPGVYVQEISKLPASVAPVATAVPAFVGYTHKRIREREEIPKDTPVMIRSLLEYEEIFGGAFEEPFSVTLKSQTQGLADSRVELGPDEEELSPYLMYYSLRFYFANGGGRCYIVSVGDGGYDESPDDSSIRADDLESGLNALRLEDEPTLLVIPEAVKLSDADRNTLYDAMLDQCADMKDRFAILDVIQGKKENPLEDAGRFRSKAVGMNNLNYGAAYYPSLQTTIRRHFNEQSVSISDDRGGAGNGPLHGNKLNELQEGVSYAQAEIIVEDQEKISAGDVLTVNGNEFAFSEEGEEGIEIKSTPIGVADQIVKVLGEHEAFTASRITGAPKIEINLTDAAEMDSIVIEFSGNAEALSIVIDKIFTIELDTSMYNRIKKELDKKTLNLYPSAGIAGVYSRVDNNRGVWKAPANVSMNLVTEPSLILTDDEQGPLNVDADSGKSINVIRQISKKGTIVWGARTLAGNDNEWRYIPVRRLFIFIEESIKKATQPVVFEPNDANTWAKTKAMIENFLTGLWRDGALAGASREEAFFVNVGLGKTMSQVDILEGRMIIEIGLAAVRPAEFIILQFMHKLQES